MPFAASLSTARDTTQAVAEVCERASEKSESWKPDLVAVFVSPHHAHMGCDLAGRLCDHFETDAIIGCQGESVVGTGREVEHGPAMSVWLAHFENDIVVEPFHLEPDEGREGPTLFGWPDGLVSTDPEQAILLTLADPYTFPLSELFFPRIREDYPGLPIVGGMSSGADGPGRTMLLRGRETVNIGAVGALIRGGPGCRAIVSQGCRPIGKPLVVTKSRDNIILEVGGQPPLKYLHDLYETLSVADQALFQRGLHVGLAINEFTDCFKRGDFLIRNLHGIDRESGSLIVTDRVRTGQTIRFQLRDAETADEDLRTLLRQDRDLNGPASGALVFTCNGRGTRLFPAANHDARVIGEEVGEVPLAGFFAAGELGPIGGQNYIHGYTAGILLFE